MLLEDAQFSCLMENNYQIEAPPATYATLAIFPHSRKTIQSPCPRSPWPPC